MFIANKASEKERREPCDVLCILLHGDCVYSWQLCVWEQNKGNATRKSGSEHLTENGIVTENICIASHALLHVGRSTRRGKKKKVIWICCDDWGSRPVRFDRIAKSIRVLAEETTCSPVVELIQLPARKWQRQREGHSLWTEQRYQSMLSFLRDFQMTLYKSKVSRCMHTKKKTLFWQISDKAVHPIHIQHINLPK